MARAVEHADALMFKAKRAGKGQVIVEEISDKLGTPMRPRFGAIWSRLIDIDHQP